MLSYRNTAKSAWFKWQDIELTQYKHNAYKANNFFIIYKMNI